MVVVVIVMVVEYQEGMKPLSKLIELLLKGCDKTVMCMHTGICSRYQERLHPGKRREREREEEMENGKEERECWLALKQEFLSERVGPVSKRKYG
jgi:hypothetical protein